MKKRMMVTVGALVLAGGAALALAGPGCGGAGPGAGMGAGMVPQSGMMGDMRDMAGGRGAHMQRYMQQALNLDDVQQEQIQDIMLKHREEMRQQRAQSQSLRGDMHKLDPGSADYQAQLQALADSQSKEVADKIMQHGAKRAEIFALLNPEQQQAFLAMQPPMGGRHGGWGRH